MGYGKSKAPVWSQLVLLKGSRVIAAPRTVAVSLLWCLAVCTVVHAQNVGCMVYNNGLRFEEEELKRLEASTEIQYVGVQIGGVAPHYGEVASRLAASGKKLVVQVWYGSWSRFSFANIAMDSKIRADFFREVIDPVIDAIGPENIHAIHMLEETGMQFATDKIEPGDPENLLDGTDGGYDSPFYTGWSHSSRQRYGGPWILTLRRHNDDFKRFSGYDLFEAPIWQGPERGLFRRWVGQHVQAQAANRFAEHIQKKYPGILATTWDGPNFGGNVMSDTPAMMNSVDGFTANAYSSPLRNYIFARTQRSLDFDKEFEFITWVGRKSKQDANKRSAMLAGIYAVGSNMISLWEEPRRCYQDPELWELMKGIYGKFSKLPVFRHTPEVFVIAGRWDIPSQYLKAFDVAHAHDAQGIGLGRYKLVLAHRADHPGMKEYVADGGLAVFVGNPSFLQKQGILVPGEKPVDFSGTYEPDDWWRKTFDLKASYKISAKGDPDFAAGKDIHKANGIAYHVRYGKGEVLVLPGAPANDGADPDWQFLLYDLIKGLLHRNGLDDTFTKHFSGRDSGGKYFQITSDDGAVTCCFYYSVGQKGPPVQVDGVDVLTGDKDPVLGPGRSAAIVVHQPLKEWQAPPPPDRTKLVKPAEKGARRGLPDLPELPAVHSLGPARAALEPGRPPVWVAENKFHDWTVADCRYRLAVRFNSSAAGVVGQPIVLTGKAIYELTGLEDLAWQSVRVFADGSELPVQVDEKDGTGLYQDKGNGRLNYDDELVFAVSTSTEAQATYHLYYDSKPTGARTWPATTVTFEKVDTSTADAVLRNGRLAAYLKGPSRRPEENVIDNFGAGSITNCTLDGKGFTRIGHNWGAYFFGNPWSYDAGWTKPELIVSGPLRSIARVHLASTTRKNKAGLKTFDGKVTHYFSMYAGAPVLDIEQRIEYRWSERRWQASYAFHAAVGQSPGPEDLLFVPVAGRPRQVTMDGGLDHRPYLEHRPEQGWMALLDPVEKHGCALFYAGMDEVRENLAWVDYAPRRELAPSASIRLYTYLMDVKYMNRVMQTDNVIDRRFRIVGLTDEDEHAVGRQYLVWGEDLTRIAAVEVHSLTD